MNKIEKILKESIIEISKNTFDCDGFNSLDFRHREHIRNVIVNNTDKILNMNNYE